MAKVKLGDVAKEYKATIKDNTGLPIVGLEHLTPGEIALTSWDEDIEKSFSKGFIKGTMLFGRRRAYLKKAAVAPFDGVCSGDIIVIQAIPEKIDPELLPFIIQNDLLFDFAMSRSAGGLSPRVKWKDLKEYEFELPERDAQGALTEILKAAYQTKCAYNKQLIATDELVKSQFIELFGDPGNNPKGWTESTLKDICLGKLSYGSGAAATDYDGETRYIRITDITDEGELNDDVKSPSTIDEKYLLKDGDILFARSGATVGKVLRYKEQYGRSIYAGFLIRLIPNTEKVIPDYVFGFTRTPFYEEFVRRTQRAVGQPNINAQEYGNLKICIPPMELQNQFSEFLKQSDKSKFALQNAIASIDDLIKSLIQNGLNSEDTQ